MEFNMDFISNFACIFYLTGPVSNPTVRSNGIKPDFFIKIRSTKHEIRNNIEFQKSEFSKQKHQFVSRCYLGFW